MKPLVLKLGGALLDTRDAINKFFVALEKYKQTQQRDFVIVHGGGCVVDKLMDKLALPVVRRNGLRVTPAEQIDVIVGGLAGSANKTLLAEAVKQSIPAIGLCLADGHTVGVTQISEELGYVGLPQAGRPDFIELLLKNQYLPIVSSIGITDDGKMMNVNADHAAVALAKTIDADLLLLSDVDGVLDADKQLITELTEAKADSLIEAGVITDGMVVKVKSAFEAAKTLNRPIEIASWKKFDQLSDLFAGHSLGTKIIV